MISGVGPKKVRDLVSVLGSPEKILTSSHSDLVSIPGIGPKLATTISTWQQSINIDKELSLAEKAGVKIITNIDDEYPPLLNEIYDPPLCLYLRGELPTECGKNIAIVGSRRVTNYGRRIAKHIAESASFAKWTIVSGLAYGIDAIAHDAVVKTKGKTIAVLGGGLSRLHPQDHLTLAREIIATGGAIISEFPMELSPTKWSFPMRNRIISGLSQGVIVIEAGLRSGSLITANCAIEQGRTVFAVPGEADNPQAQGTNSLIKNGATLTESFDDILEEFEFLPTLRSEEKKAIESQDFEKNYSKDEKKILNALKSGEQSADQLISETGLPPGGLLATLMKLEIQKVIIQLPGKRFALKK